MIYSRPLKKILDKIIPFNKNETIHPSNLGSGTTDGTKYLRDDGVWSNLPSTSGFVPYTGATQNVDLGEYSITAGQVNLDISPTGTYIVGSTRWDNPNGTSETLLKGGNVSLKNGVDLVTRVVNKVTPNQTVTRAQYQVVKVSGAQGQRLAIDLAQGDEDLNSADTLGVVIETIPTNQEGFIMTVGQLTEINTTGSLQGESWSDGDVLYLSPTTRGAMTNVKPNGLTGHIVVLGYIEYAHAIHGKIYVKIMNGWELDELHNVYISSPSDNDILYYDLSSNLWRSKQLTSVPIYNNNSILYGGSSIDEDTSIYNGGINGVSKNTNIIING